MGNPYEITLGYPNQMLKNIDPEVRLKAVYS